MNIEIKLNNLLKMNRINRSEFSRLSGIPYSTISSIYDPKISNQNLRLTTLKKIADFFGVTIEYLINDDLAEIPKKSETVYFSNDEFTTEELEKIKEFAGYLKIQKTRGK